ncbi:MAG: heavy-metal-associated domain-containing protein [Mycoplasmataceae bacterium]|nr:heavy-metal-associated domain-containing protein [Mycoplasmataceae bacterium]
MTKLKLKVNMTCSACANNIDKTLKKLGVNSVSNPALKITKVEYDETKIDSKKIVKKIKAIGYEAEETK